MFAAVSAGDRSRLTLGEIVTGNYFQMLGVGAARGRTLLPEDDRPEADRVVVVSHRYWQRVLGRDPNVLGRPLLMRGRVYTIVGVVERRFTGMVPMLSPDLWVSVREAEEVEPAGINDIVPSPTGTTRLDRRGQRWLFVKGRLRAGMTIDQARANLEVLMARLAAAHPPTNKDRRPSVIRTADVRVHPQGDALILFIGLGLMAAVGLVLLIACANVASMLLARAGAEQFWRRALERVSSLAGVESAALAARLPFNINFNVTQVHVAGHASPGDRGFAIQNTRVSDAYFRTLDVPIVE